ncbi:hypothetical protein ELK79_28395, partial [Klebsiella pneumoniae]|nr:hypothetical protein [Klebsiella pneumoniae]
MPYFTYDVWMYDQVYQHKTVILLPAILSAPLFLFLIYLDYLVHLKQYNSAWAVIYEFLILN